MSVQSGTFTNFLSGLALGGLLTATAGTGLLVLLHINQVLDISVLFVPEADAVLDWIAVNLRFSVIPFALILILFVFSLARGLRLLEQPGIQPEEIGQADHLLDVWTNLFFGIGVIWTAIGMRSALVQALGGLDPGSASRLGAFAILERLVDGGILLALSTTIFGAVGGYCLRVIKSITVGRRFQAYFHQLEIRQRIKTEETLESMEAHLSQLVERAPSSAPASFEPQDFGNRP